MLDKLKSLFVVSDEDPKTKEDNKQKDIQKSIQTDKQNTKSKSVSIPKVSGSLNEKIMDKLLTVLSDNNQEGFDYIEYKNSLKALAKMPMDEKTKFRSAFATAQTIGVTVPKLLDSIKFYQDVLNKENDSFLSALNHQVTLKVGDKEKEMKNFEQMIKDKSAQVKQLTDDIANHQKVIVTLKSKIDNDTIKIQQTRSDFETTFYKLMHQIKEDVKKIKEYLQ